jgi:hypothetical protein
MSIYHVIYKTIHEDGRYYIGRHSTTNLNDSYLGSGNWVLSIEDKTFLKKEIIATALTVEELKELETQLIKEHFDDPLNMNQLKSGSGYTRELALERVARGNHNFTTPAHRDNTKKHAKQRVLEGKHNFQIANPVHKQIAAGTHHFQTNHPSKTKMTCPHCNKVLGRPLFLRWHGENCKIRK